MAEETTSNVESTVREIRRKTRKKYSAEDKVRIVLEGLRGEEKIAELCRREGIHQNMYYKWSKEFLEAGCMSSEPLGQRGQFTQVEFPGS
jgi:transposase